MRDIFEGDNFTDDYKQLTNKIRVTLEPIFQERIAKGNSRKGIGMAVVDVVHAMVPSLGDSAEPLKKDPEMKAGEWICPTCGEKQERYAPMPHHLRLKDNPDQEFIACAECHHKFAREKRILKESKGE